MDRLKGLHIKRRCSCFSTQDQDNDVICITETQWSGKHGKNVGQRALGYLRLPWCSAKSNSQRKEVAVCLKDANACSEDQDKSPVHSLLCLPINRVSSKI